MPYPCKILRCNNNTVQQGGREYIKVAVGTQSLFIAWLESLTNGSNNQLQTFSSIILIKRKRVTCVNGTWGWTNWFQNSKVYFLCTNSMNSVVTPICLTISIPKTEKRMLHEECKVKYHKVDSSRKCFLRVL